MERTWIEQVHYILLFFCKYKIGCRHLMFKKQRRINRKKRDRYVFVKYLGACHLAGKVERLPPILHILPFIFFSLHFFLLVFIKWSIKICTSEIRFCTINFQRKKKDDGHESDQANSFSTLKFILLLFVMVNSQHKGN